LSSHKYVFSFVGRNTCKYSLHASLGMRVWLISGSFDGKIELTFRK
jgi:hypothetical protein